MNDLPPFTQDILSRAVRASLESPGETVRTVLFGAVVAFGFWWLRSRREQRPVLSFPNGWRQNVIDWVGVTLAGLAVMFILSVGPALYERDAAQQAIVDELQSKLENAALEDPTHAQLLSELKSRVTQLEGENRAWEIAIGQADTRADDLEARLRDANETVRQLRAEVSPAPELSVTQTAVSYVPESKTATIEIRLSNTGEIGVTVRVGLVLNVGGVDRVLMLPDEPRRLATKTNLSLKHPDIAMSNFTTGQVRLTAAYDHDGKRTCYSYIGNLNTANKTLNYISGDTTACS